MSTDCCEFRLIHARCQALLNKSKAATGSRTALGSKLISKYV